jgi:hypothetical protein
LKLNKNKVSLWSSIALGACFIIAGAFDVLHLFVIKVAFITALIILFILVVLELIKNKKAT